MQISFSSHSSMNLSSYTSNSRGSVTTNNALNKETERQKKADSKKKSSSLKFNNPSGTMNQNKNNMIKSLMERKENLSKNKQSIIENAIKKGEDSTTINDKLKDIDKQIEDITKQITKLQTNQEDKTSDGKDTTKKSKKVGKKDSKEATPGAISSDSMENIIGLSTTVSQNEALTKQAKEMSGQERVLNSEIKIDEGRGINPVDKKKEVSKIEDNLQNISQRVGDNMQKINDTIKESNEVSQESNQSDSATVLKVVTNNTGETEKNNKDVHKTEARNEKDNSTPPEILAYVNSKNYTSNSLGENVNTSV